MKTPRGRHLGRRPDKYDPKDRRFAPVRLGFASSVPEHVDLRGPRADDQGGIGSCGAHAITRMMEHMWPEFGDVSRLDIYGGVREMRNEFYEDSGVETRDLFKFVRKSGGIEENAWPYNVANIYRKLTRRPDKVYRLASYERLRNEQDIIECLSSGYKFVLGYSMYESFDGEEIARTGVMTMPDPRREKFIGGHAVCVEGYSLNFKETDAFKQSGVDPALVENRALLICNSWGESWGLAGRFWMPMSYALAPATGNDAWTGKRYENFYAPTGLMGAMTSYATIEQLDAAFTTLRAAADETSYGRFISDATCRDIGERVANAVVQATKQGE